LPPQVLLLSEREADRVLEVLHSRQLQGAQDPSPGATLVHMCYATQPGAPTAPACQALALSAAGQRVDPPPISPDVAACTRFFNGCTSFGKLHSPLFDSISERLRRAGGREAALDMLDMRAKVSSFLRSDLELACD
jgi:hypothetical protein